MTQFSFSVIYSRIEKLIDLLLLLSIFCLINQLENIYFLYLLINFNTYELREYLCREIYLFYFSGCQFLQSLLRGIPAQSINIIIYLLP
jgi:hypothetical protein